ncbi:MAG: helix-turn-helix transcriptional regulator [Candidatus Sulfotelmatobacter sp.]
MTSVENVDFHIAPRQIRAARALLGWNQRELAEKAKVAASTVADFERGKHTPVPNNLDALRGALEAGGVSLLPGGAVIGPKRSLGAATVSAKGSPNKLITATDLSRWADRLDAKALFPELVRRLILVSTGNSADRVDFPSDESIQLGGWDGICEQHLGTNFQWLPQGVSGWELSTQRSGTLGKANGDYDKRTAEPGELDRSQTTFVFATLKHWRPGSSWVSTKRKDKAWADVHFIDADGFAQWIELFPSVGYWLATHLGRVCPGVLPLADLWKEWRLSTRWPMTSDLLLAGRDDEAIGLLKWLYGDPAIRPLQADSSEEAAAFLFAAIDQLPEPYRTFYHSRCLIASTDDAARLLGTSPSPLVVVVEASEPGLAARLVEQGHHVLVTYGSAIWASDAAQILPRAPHEAFRAALEDMGVPADQGAVLTRDTIRSLAILRRLIPSGAAARIPTWADQSRGHLLLPALLAGAWDSRRDGDRRILEQLSGETFDDFESRCAQWTGFPDAPLRHAGTAWKIASPRDAWFRLAGFLSRPHLERFSSVAKLVLGAADPRFELDPSERWLAGIRGKLPEHSPWLASGLTETLLLLSMYGGRVHAVANAQQFSSSIVSSLLADADDRRWWSLSHQLRTLAEAAPDTFLDAVEQSLARSDRPVMALFKEDGGLMGGAHHSNLLWALEVLAWSPQYIARACKILARLAALDPGGQYANRPKNSLRSIFLLWHPETNATLAERVHVLDGIRKFEPQAAWNLMLNILPRGHDTATPTPKPRWRDFSVENEEVVTYGLIADGAVALSERLVEDAQLDPQRWAELVEHIPNLNPQWRQKALTALASASQSMSDDTSRMPVWAALRQLLHHHRSFPEAQWALPGEELDKIEVVYRQFEPNDRVNQQSWLFSDRAQLLSGKRVENWEARDAELLAMRRAAVTELLSLDDFEVIIRLANEAENARWVGFAFGEVSGDSSEADDVLRRTLGDPTRKIKEFALGLTIALLQQKGQEWSMSILSRAQRENWSKGKIVDLLLALPLEKNTWDAAASFGDVVRRDYWKRTHIFWRSEDKEANEYAIRQLVEVGRASGAVDFIAGSQQIVSGELIASVLLDAASPSPHTSDATSSTMFQWSVAQLLKRLDADNTVPETVIAQLEWIYLGLLEHSERLPIVLHRSMSKYPAFFIQVLSATCVAHSASAEDRTEITDEAKAVASHAFRLLQSWNIVPGASETGIDAPALISWVREAHRLAQEADREAVGDQYIGHALSFSKSAPDGTWPDLPVRGIIEEMNNRNIETGILVAIHNNRGATSRALFDGGGQERGVAQKYRIWADALKLDWPTTSSLLERIARSFEQDAQMHDEHAEHTDWEF